MSFLRTFPSWTLLFGLAGCQAAVPSIKHLAMFRGDGRSIDPRSGGGLFFSYRVEDAEEFSRHVGEIVEGIRAGNSSRVLIYIHGGLNSQPGSIDNAHRLHPLIEKEGLYPLFINWQSSLGSSYVDHLLFIRQGKDRGWKGVFLSPFYFLIDLSRGVVRLPIVWYFRVREWVDQAARGGTSDFHHANRAVELFSGKHTGNRLIPIAAGEDKTATNPLRGGLRFIWYVGTLPLRGLGTLLIDTAGQGGWDVMLRRTRLLFQWEDEFTSEMEKRIHRKPEGLLLLMDRLGLLQEELELKGQKLDFILVAHSMGAIVANQLLQHRRAYFKSDPAELGQPWKPGNSLRVPAFREIVYMAAACTVRDFEASVFPYLETHVDVVIHNLMLHPRSEVEETNLSDCSPRGSLLVWIDDYLAKPLTPLDRTAGRYENLMPALHGIPESLRSRIRVKVFDRGVPSQPQRHGEFNEGGDGDEKFRFWMKEDYRIEER